LLHIIIGGLAEDGREGGGQLTKEVLGQCGHDVAGTEVGCCVEGLTTYVKVHHIVVVLVTSLIYG
jgi:hypothetical protein